MPGSCRANKEGGASLPLPVWMDMEKIRHWPERRQGLPQWTEARLVPEFAQIFGAKVVEKHWAADDAVRHCPTHLRAAVVTTVIIALSFFNVFAPLSLLGSPFFYLLLPLSWLSIRSAVTARRMLRAGNIEAAMKRTDRTVLLITLNAVVAITLFPFHVVAEIFW